MATLIPTINSCIRKMTSGERRFARRLEGLLEDDYLCWYEIPVGKRQRYTDFIILHPGRGLLFLEVKDWKLETIQKIDKASVTLLTNSGIKVVSNPLEQARQCAYQLVNKLQRDLQLIHHEGTRKGQLIFPYGYGVVLSNISRKQFESTDLDQVIPSHQVICKDEMTDKIEAEAFQERLWHMFNVQFGFLISLPQIDRVRWHIFPEVRVDTKTPTLFPPDENDELIPDLIKIMDMQQEQLARSLGEGHRVIHGVAGSGKTLILGYRCLQLAKLLNKPILVLCYNITLAARLRAMMEEKEINDRVHVYHFHDWCGEQLNRYHVEKPKHGDNYIDQMVQNVINAVENNQIPKGQYGALMIDEGHDFKPEWLELVVKMVDPDTSSLLLLYDDAQSIYQENKPLDFSLSSVGIQARGRTTILKVNYRNTQEILDFSYRFAQHYFKPNDSDEDHVPLVEPESVGRHGPAPYLKQLKSFQDEAEYIAKTIYDRHKEWGPWKDMCVMYPHKWMGNELQKVFSKYNVPHQLLSTSSEKKKFSIVDDSVKLMTIHSSKGLEFPVVAISGLGYLLGKNVNMAAEAKLLYVAMTRSTDKLILTYHQPTEFISRMLGETKLDKNRVTH